MKKIRITLNACWNEPSEIRQLKKDWKLKEKNIKATFRDGGDYYSSWTFTGPVNEVEAIVRENWCIDKNTSLEDAVEEIGGDISYSAK